MQISDSKPVEIDELCETDIQRLKALVGLSLNDERLLAATERGDRPVASRRYRGLARRRAYAQCAGSHRVDRPRVCASAVSTRNPHTAISSSSALPVPAMRKRPKRTAQGVYRGKTDERLRSGGLFAGTIGTEEQMQRVAATLEDWCKRQ